MSDVRRLLLAAFSFSLISFALVGCGDESVKTGDAAKVPEQQKQAANAQEDFMNSQNAAKKK